MLDERRLTQKHTKYKKMIRSISIGYLGPETCELQSEELAKLAAGDNWGISLKILHSMGFLLIYFEG